MEEKVGKIWMNLLTWGVRILVGATFAASGFVKAIDPWGFLYKSNDYLAALSLDIWPNLQLVGVFGLSAIEFLVGIFLLFGCFRRSVSVVAAVIMCGMLPLTLWLAISDPVKDCGCFGDALILSNWASFWKNIALSAGVVWLCIYNRIGHWLVTPALQWLACVVSATFIVTIEFYGYDSQPLIDFRPYPVGSALIDCAHADTRKPHFVFVYEKDGDRIRVNEDDELPDESDGWVFIDREEVIEDKISEASSTKEKNFRIWSQIGDEDVTEDVINESGNELIVMIPDLKEVSPATTWKLNSLFEWSEKHNVKMVGVVAGSSTEISDWEDISMASYPIYTADDTQIKEVVRGNPGIVYLMDGIVEWKSTLTALNIDDFMSPEIADDAKSFGTDYPRILRNCTYMYLICMVVLVFLSFLPKIKDYYLNGKRGAPEDHEVTHDDTVHRE